MRMSNSPSHRLLDHRLLAQSNYRNSISPSSIYSEDEDRNSEQSGGGNLSSAQTAVNNLLGNTNNSSSSSATGNTNNNQFPFTMNGANNQSDLQQTLVAQQAANAAAAQLVRKLQQHHNQLNNNNSSNNSAVIAAAAQLSNSNASNAFSNYSALYNAAAAAINSGADIPLLGNINNLANSLKNSVNNSHALANVLNSSNGGQTNSPSNGPSPQSPYIATNQYTEITYKGHPVAAFLAANKTPTEYLLCLPQAFELFLKHLVGGLHTVYTKLKRLDIVPIVCNVEQVRILRGRGAIQPGVNRCKLLSTKDFDILYKDCTTARNSPGIGSLHAFNGNSNNLANLNSANNSTSTTNSNQANSNQNNSANQSNSNNPILGSADFNTTAAYLWLLSQQQQQQNNSSNRNSSSNGGGLLNGDLVSPNSNTNHNNSSTNGSSSLTNNTLSALNLTRSLTNLASGNGTGANSSANQISNTSELIGTNNNNSKTNNLRLDETTDEDDLDDEMEDSESLRGSHSNLSNNDNHQNIFNGFKGENNNRTETPNTNDQLNNNQRNNQISNIIGPALLNSNKEDDAVNNKDTTKDQLPFGKLGLSNLINNSDDLFRSLNRSNNLDLKNGNALLLGQNISSIGNNLSTNTDSLESLLRNIENLVSIAVQNARQQQQQLNLHKAGLRAELLNVAEKERDFREQLERQLNEEQRIRLLYQKRFKKERRFRKKIEQDLQQVQNKIQQSDRPSNDRITNSNGRAISPIKQESKTSIGNGLDNRDNGNSPSYSSPASTNDNLKETSLEEKDSEMAVD